MVRGEGDFSKWHTDIYFRGSVVLVMFYDVNQSLLLQARYELFVKYPLFDSV